MTRILILYGTTDGHTAKIARRLGDTLRARGADSDVVNVAHATPRPAGYDGVIVAASVHTGAYQPEVRQWVRTHAPAIRRFLASVDWEPTITKAVAGAVLYTRYGWLKRWLMRRIVAKAGGDTDTSRDYEYTDWADLDRFAQTFAAVVARRLADAGGYAQPA